MKTDVRVVSNVPRVYQATRTVAGQAIELAVQHAAREAERLTSQTFYPPASTPGRPPHMRTQELTSGIAGTVRVIETRHEATGIFGTDKIYGLWLEIGNSATNLKPRPFLRPALDSTIKVLPKLLKRAFGARFKSVEITR